MKELLKAQKTVQELSRFFGVSRKTAYKWKAPVYGGRSTQRCEIDLGVRVIRPGECRRFGASASKQCGGDTGDGAARKSVPVCESFIRASVCPRCER